MISVQKMENDHAQNGQQNIEYRADQRNEGRGGMELEDEEEIILQHDLGHILHHHRGHNVVRPEALKLEGAESRGEQSESKKVGVHQGESTEAAAAEQHQNGKHFGFGRTRCDQIGNARHRFGAQIIAIDVSLGAHHRF